MKLPNQSISHIEARALGYQPLTTAYTLPRERAMLDAVQKDLDRTHADYALVGDREAPEVWRKNMIIAPIGADRYRKFA